MLLAPSGAFARDAVDRILQAGLLRCAVSVAADDYSRFTTHGDLSSFGADVCRAVAASLLGDARKVVLDGYPDEAHALDAVSSGTADIDVGATPDVSHSLAYHVAFAPPVLFDEQGFLVDRRSGVTAAKQLAGKLVCFIAGTAQQEALQAWSAEQHVRIVFHEFDEMGEMEAALTTGKCDAITDFVSSLGHMRAAFHARVSDFVILPEKIAVEPFAPALPSSEPRLLAIVSDVISSLIEAERLGITQSNVAGASDDPAVQHLLGATPGIARTLGMSDLWAKRAIAAVGNYAELFSRDLGQGSALKLGRGPNTAWSAGGMLFALPLR